MELIGFGEEYDLRSGEWASWMRFLGPSGEVRIPAPRETIEALAVVSPLDRARQDHSGAATVRDEEEPDRVEDEPVGDEDGEEEEIAKTGPYSVPPDVRRKPARVSESEEPLEPREL